MVWNMIPYNAKKCQNIVKIFKNFKNFLCQKLAVCLFTPAHKSKEECNTNIRVIPGTHHAHNCTLTILRFVATSLLL